MPVSLCSILKVIFFFAGSRDFQVAEIAPHFQTVFLYLRNVFRNGRKSLPKLPKK